MRRLLFAAWVRLERLVTRRRLDRDLDEELAFHLAMREADYRAAGLAPSEARALARRRFGNVTQFKEEMRDMWTAPSIESIFQDVRYAVRALRRSPGFAAVAILALAIGIGGSTAMFSLVDAVRLHALPYPAPERLVALWGNVVRAKVERRGASYPDFVDWRAQSTSFDGMSLGGFADLTISGTGDPNQIHVDQVSASYFSLLGVDAAVGRTFSSDEDDLSRRAPVVVLSDALW